MASSGFCEQGTAVYVKMRGDEGVLKKVSAISSGFQSVRRMGDLLPCMVKRADVLV